MSKSAPQFDKILKETANLGTQYTDACTKSGEIFMKGMEDMVGTMVSLAQESAEKQAGFMKRALESRTVNELAEVQSSIAKESFEDFVSGATKISEIGTKILTESVEPVSAQVTKTVQKASKSMAA